MAQAKSVHRKFPTLATAILILGIVWLLNELGIFIINISWFPILVIVVGLGWIINHYTK